MPGFYVWLSREICSEHGEIVRNDGIEFVISPRFSDLFVISHLTCPDSSGKSFGAHYVTFTGHRLEHGKQHQHFVHRSGRIEM
jgi:hypothetical protein